MAGLRDSLRGGATGRLFCPQWPLARDTAYLIYPREAEFEQDGRKESPL